jgi:TIR domain
MPRPTTKRIFISYSHQDKQWHDDLYIRMKPYLRVGSIIGWSDEQITSGSEWFEEIESARINTNVAVLLVTPNFLASDFIYEHELGPFLKQAQQKGVRILWVPVRTCAYKKTPLKDYQAVLDPARPLADMTEPERDRAWVQICDEIEKAVEISEDTESTIARLRREFLSTDLADELTRISHELDMFLIRQPNNLEARLLKVKVDEALRQADLAKCAPAQTVKDISPLPRETWWSLPTSLRNQVWVLFVLFFILALGLTLLFWRSVKLRPDLGKQEYSFPHPTPTPLATPIRGKMVIFGILPGTKGKVKDIRSNETLSLVEPNDLQKPEVAKFFLKEQPPNTTGLMPRLDPSQPYLSCKYSENLSDYLKSHLVTVTNPANPARHPVKAKVVDRGPPPRPEYKGAAAALSQGLADALGLKEGDEVEISFEPN